MNDIKTVTIQIAAHDHEQLIARAQRQGTSPEGLAGAYVRAGLTSGEELDAEMRRQTGLEALKGLAALRERLPDVGPVDVVQIVHDGRSDLDHRTMQ